MIIRPASPDDVAAIATLVVASYRASFLTILGEKGLSERRQDFFEERFSLEYGSIHIAEDGQGALLGLHQVRDGLLDLLFVSPSVTGQGIGAVLLADAERQGARRLCCFADNTAARQFYEKHGWNATNTYSRPFSGLECSFVDYIRPEI